MQFLGISFKTVVINEEMSAINMYNLLIGFPSSVAILRFNKTVHLSSQSMIQWASSIIHAKTFFGRFLREAIFWLCFERKL